jgi:hypothetical protein
MKNNNFGSSWGQRMAANIVIYKIFINNPKYFLFGFKAGDAKEIFFEEGKKVAFKEIRFLGSYTHLHNQYLQLWVDGSIFALILLIAYFIFLYKYAPNPLTLGIITIFVISFFADVMLYRPKTYMLFLFVSAVLIKYSSNDYETSSIEKGDS